MSLNFYLGEVTAQSAAAKQMANEYMQFCGTLKDSVNAFMNAPLSGKTYDSAKLYFSTVYPTLASGFILACEALIEAHSKFPEEFQSQVDTCDVIEDQLKAEIAQGQALLQSMARTMDKEKEPNQRLEQRYMGVQSSIQKNEERLQRLYEFNAGSPGLFADFEAQLANLDAGLAEVEKGAAWNSGSGTFDLGRMNMAWTKPINTRWKKREEMRQAKLKNGSTGKANTLADHGLTEADLVQVSDPPELVYQKYIKFAALGLNPHTGKPLTDKEKLQFQYAAHAGTMSDLIGLVGGAYAGQKASNASFYKGNSPKKVKNIKTDFGAEKPVLGDDWNNYFKKKYGVENVRWKPTSFDDIIENPARLYGSTKNEIQSILGPDWIEDTYGTAGNGWKFINPGDGMVFYHPGEGIHVGSYYGFSSGKTGKIKIIKQSDNYIPTADDGATIITIK